MIHKDRKCAFTLSEVLIVVAIVAVISAITLSTISKNIQKIRTIAKLKVTYAKIYQSIKLAESDYGPIGDWDLRLYKDSNYYNAKNSKKVFDTYFKPYLKTATECGQPGTKTGCTAGTNLAYNFRLSNGASVNFSCYPHDSSYKKYYIRFHIYINGKERNYISGKNFFCFDTDGGVFAPCGYYNGVTVQDIKDGKVKTGDLSHGKSKAYCTKNNRNACGLYLYLNKWEIPEDYPW